MSTYRLTVSGHNTKTGEQHTFRLDASAYTADEARRSIGNNPVVDPSDNTWFDEWLITATRKRGA